MKETDQSAPGQLELIRSLVNTLDVELGSDELATGEGATAWIAENDPRGAIEVDEAGRLLLIEVREALRALLLANNLGEPPPADALEVLNAQVPAPALGIWFHSNGADLVSPRGSIAGSASFLLAIVHEAIHADTWARLKVCPADDCRWAFYDHSRNRSGTWCTMGVCGNRSKARSFRERHGTKTDR